MSKNTLFPELEIKDKKLNSRSGTFLDNMKLPIHRWYRYSAGYSAEWVKEVINYINLSSGSIIFDPFAGSGTTLLAANECGFESIGFEQHYFIRRLANAKLSWKQINTKNYIDKVNTIIKYAKKDLQKPILFEIPLLKKCYSIESMQRLEALKKYYILKKNRNDFQGPFS